MRDILDTFTFGEATELLEKIEKERPNAEKTELVIMAYKYGFEAGYKEAKENK